MTKPATKARERWYLDRFRQLCPDFPGGTVDDSEEPDFLVHGPQQCLGIELTQLFRPTPPGQQPMKAVESLQYRLCSRAMRLFEDAGGPPLSVAVIFSDHEPLTKASVQPLAQKIAGLVARINPQEDDDLRLENDYADLAVMPPAINVVFIRRSPRITKSLWAPLRGAGVPTFSVGEVATVIADKDRRCPVYRKKCQALWLIMVLDGGDLSSKVDLPEDIAAHRFETTFDRLFIFRSFEAEVIELARL